MSGLITKSVINTDGPSHPLFSLNGGKHFGRILKSDRSFTQRVGNGEKVDESSRWEWLAKLSIASYVILTRQQVLFAHHDYQLF